MGHDVLSQHGFICRGNFERPHVEFYTRRFSTPVSHPYVDGMVAKLLREQGFDIKAGLDPSNLFDPEQLYESLARYRKPQDYHPVDQAMSEAFDFAFSIFAKPTNQEHLRALGDVDVLQTLKDDTSSGISFPGKKGVNKVAGLRREKQVRKNEKAPNPCQAFARTQRGNKTRLVWGYPIEMTIMENRFSKPLLYAFLHMQTPLAMGMARYQIGAMIDCNMKGREIYSFDFSRYDQTVHSTLILRAFSILETWFTGEDRTEYCWNKIRDYFIRTPLVMPDGKLYTGKERGIPSGSGFTSLIGSIVNVMILKYSLSLQSIELYRDSFLVLGDDSILAVSSVVNMDKLVHDLNMIGMVINKDKSGHNSCHFLGAYWRKGLPKLEHSEILKRLVSPEKSRYKRKMTREDVLRIATDTINNASAAWVNAAYFSVENLHLSAQMWKAPRSIDHETLHAVERMRRAEGFILSSGPPHLRVLR